MVTPLERKLLRDLWRLKGQVITLAFVVAGGIASFVGLRSTFRSLEDSRAIYYERYRLADLFAGVERAPEAVADRLAALDGVAQVYTRVVEELRLPQPPGTLPGTGRLVSLPDAGEPPLNAIHLRSGRMPEAGTGDEVLLLEAYATARGLKAGDRLPAVVGGRMRDLRIVGIALSPEYVYAIRPGALSDERGRFAILWMRRDALAAAYGYEGAFNDVVLRLQPGAAEAGVRDAVDRVLAPWGGRGAVLRARQASNQILQGELTQLGHLSTMITAIFLSVAAFLVNIVLSRLIALQRQEIAALKALGYANREVGVHYFGVVAATVLLGALIGTGVGLWFGRWMTALYSTFFRFPVLSYRLTAGVLAVAVLISLAAAAVGAFIAIRAAVRLPPAQAMRPPAPTVYRVSPLERWGLTRLFGPSALMVAREAIRRPVRTLLSAVGVGAAVGILVLGRFSFDAFEYMLTNLLGRQQREDVTITFARPLPARAVGEVMHLPGVLAAEGIRTSPVRLRHGHRTRDTAIIGLPREGELRAVVDNEGAEQPLPASGLVLTETLAELLGVGPGEEVQVLTREGRIVERTFQVAATVNEAFGLQAYLPRAALARLLGEDDQVSAVLARVDPRARADLLRAVERSPVVLSVDDRAEAIAGLRAQMGRSTAVITAVVTALAMAIAIGVVYNYARVALSQRARDLATLRVLGFSRREISAVLLGELALQVMLGLPIGLVLGRWWAGVVAATVDPETFRFPAVVAPSTYAMAMGVALLAGAASALWVRRRLDRLDLIAVLKTRE